MCLPVLKGKQITIINILIDTVDLNLYSICGCPLHPYAYRHLCMLLCQKKMLKAAFPKTLKSPSLLLRPPWSASELLPFHKVSCKEVFCGMATLRTEEEALHRDFLPLYSLLGCKFLQAVTGMYYTHRKLRFVYLLIFHF